VVEERQRQGGSVVGVFCGPPFSCEPIMKRKVSLLPFVVVALVNLLLLGMFVRLSVAMLEYFIRK
jgi:hypothetical protein